MPDVLITIDTEFSAGGYFTSGGTPVTTKAVYCPYGGDDHGLPFMLETFKANGIKATFFVEAAHTHLLGTDPMAPAVSDILSAGHDVQLHLHPMWLADPVDDGSPINDSMALVSHEDAERLFEIGLKAFEKWDAPKPVAFRAGNLQMGAAAYDAMVGAGIRISSSVGLAVHAPDDPSLHLKTGVHPVGEAIEIPVTSYTEAVAAPMARLKTLTITGCGFGETHTVITNAQRQGLDDVVVLTHPFEFIKKQGAQFDILNRNRVNQTRLEKLCHWIAQTDWLEAATFAEKADRWIAAPQARNENVTAPPIASLGRMVENTLNDRLMWF